MSGTIRVAPFSSLKSVNAHMVLHTRLRCGIAIVIELVVAMDRLGRLAGPITAVPMVESSMSSPSTPRITGRTRGVHAATRCQTSP